MTRAITLTTLICLIAGTSCIKPVNADQLLKGDEKVYIRSYISPQDTILRVHVSRILPSVGVPIYLNDPNANFSKFLITDAEVTLMDENGNGTQLFYAQGEQNYTAPATDLQIKENTAYFLNVVVDGQQYDASCTIPKKIGAINETITIRTTNWGTQADVQMTFDDFAGENNFYTLGAILEQSYQNGNGETESTTYPLDLGNDEFLTDVLQDGGALTGKIENIDIAPPQEGTTRFILQVAHIDEILFQNLKASSLNNDAEGNPFIEYSIAPDNIAAKEALGVFAGYQLTQKTIEIKP